METTTIVMMAYSKSGSSELIVQQVVLRNENLGLEHYRVFRIEELAMAYPDAIYFELEVVT